MNRFLYGEVGLNENGDFVIEKSIPNRPPLFVSTLHLFPYTGEVLGLKKQTQS